MTNQTNPSHKAPPFAVFRARDALPYDEVGAMTGNPVTQVEAEGGMALTQAGALAGSRATMVYSRPGLSLTHVWFKSGYPLPRHSHNADCLYFILAGSLRIGTEELGPGDGFFVGSDVPYTYTPGEKGVEVLEIRTADAFDIRLLANNANWWSAALDKVLAQREGWAGEVPPSGIVFGAPAA